MLEFANVSMKVNSHSLMLDSIALKYNWKFFTKMPLIVLGFYYKKDNDELIFELLSYLWLLFFFIAKAWEIQKKIRKKDLSLTLWSVKP